MTIRDLFLGVGLVIGAAAGFASADQPAATGLAGLNEQLNSTGRIGGYAPPPPAQIAPAASENDTAPRALELRSVDRLEAADRPTQTEGLAEEELLRTEPPVSACRVEVARRKQITPQKVAANEVLLRFTVEPDGRVRDAEAVAAPGTDLEVAACAKRVLSEWLFAKHPRGLIAVKRTYRFR
jgi:hypothetical protein